MIMPATTARRAGQDAHQQAPTRGMPRYQQRQRKQEGTTIVPTTSSTHAGVSFSYICIAFIILGRVARGREGGEWGREKRGAGCQSKFHRVDSLWGRGC